MTPPEAFPYKVAALGVGELIDNALYLWRDNFLALLCFGAVLMFPADILVDALVEFMLTRQTPIIDGDLYSATVTRLPLASLLANAVITSAVFATLAEAAGYHFLAMRYIGENVSIRQALVKAFTSAPRLIPIHMFFYVVYGVLGTSCIPLGMAFYGVFLLRIPVIVNENERSVYGFYRSVQLLQGHYPHAAMILITIFLATFPFDLFTPLTEVPVLGIFVGALVRVLALGFEVSAVTALYFSSRSRNEHMDLDLIARRIDDQQPGTTPL